MRHFKNFGRKAQGGWVQLIAAAISAAAAAKASSDARRARLGAQEAQAQQAGLSYEQQKEFAQNAIQWRVADAKKAGLHPLSALGASGASYQPPSYSLYPYDPSPTLALGSALGRLGQGVADYYSSKAREDSGEYAQRRSFIEYDNGNQVEVIPVAQPGAAEYGSLSSSYDLPYAASAPYGMVSTQEKPSMAYWAIPELGRVIAPDASNFSESLEGVESPVGQALILYLNRGLGMRALEWLMSKMPSFDGRSLSGLIRLGDVTFGGGK